MKKILVALTLALTATLSTTHAMAEEKPLPKPEILSEETISTSQKLSAYDTIIIRDFTTEGATYERVDDEERAKIDVMKPMLVRNISDSLEMELKLKKLFKSIQRNGDAKGKALVLEGSISEFNAGSRALKFFVGFGAGMAYLKVKGRLIDAQTGKELASFEDRETGYRGAVSLESYEDLFPHQAKSIGGHLANFIEKLY